MKGNIISLDIKKRKLFNVSEKMSKIIWAIFVKLTLFCLFSYREVLIETYVKSFLCHFFADVATVVGYLVVSRPFLNLAHPRHLHSTHSELLEVREIIHAHKESLEIHFSIFNNLMIV